MAATNANHAYASPTLHEQTAGSVSPTSAVADPSLIATASTSSSASLEAVKDITFGSLAGISGKFIEYPFDTVKVRLQSHVPSATSPAYRGPLDCFIRSYRYDGGMSSLYRGISAPLFGAAVETSSLFFSYRIAQDVMVELFPNWRDTSQDMSKPKLPFGGLIFCGALSGAFTSLLLTPIELVKCRMQVPSMATSLGYKSPTPFSIISSVFKHEGIFGFWHGQLGTLIRETGGSAAWFGSYEGVCRAFKRQQAKVAENRTGENSQLPIWQQLLAGAAAGMSYNFLFYPADTIKSRMQTEDSFAPTSKNSPLTHSSALQTKSPENVGSSPNPQRLSSAKQTFGATGKSIWKEHGIKGFYKGCGITVARSAPSSAFIFAIYEGLRGWLG